MEPGPLNNRDALPTASGVLEEDGQAAANRDGELRVIGGELTTDGLQQVALLLLRIGKLSEQATEIQPDSGPSA